MTHVPPVLEITDVTRTFTVSGGLFSPAKNLNALRGVSLKLHKGDVLGVVGESGCGKSTLARLLLGLDNPTSGSIVLDGEPITRQRVSVISRRIQPIFQDPYSSLNPRKTISTIISLPLRVHRIGDSASQQQAVRTIMERVGLPSRLANAYPNQLSGGQRQRVAIARALIMNPDVVICDEPTSALDVSVQSQILNLLHEMRETLNLTYVFISHNLAVVEHLATRVAVMYLGRIVEEADAEEFFAHPRHPYSQALLASVLTPEPRLGLPDISLGSAFPNPLDVPPGCAFHPRCPFRFEPCDKIDPIKAEVNGHRVECHLVGSQQ
jgi:peptide/nickel transport system ATP-binding protein